MDTQAAQHAQHQLLLEVEELVELALDGVRGLVDAGAGVDDAGVDAQRLVADVVRAGEEPADAEIAGGDQRIGAARPRGPVDELRGIDAQRLHFAELGVEGETQCLAHPVVRRILAQVLEVEHPDDVVDPRLALARLRRRRQRRRRPRGHRADVEEHQVGALHLVVRMLSAAGELWHPPGDVAEQLGDGEGAVAVAVGLTLDAFQDGIGEGAVAEGAALFRVFTRLGGGKQEEAVAGRHLARHLVGRHRGGGGDARGSRNGTCRA